MKIINKFFVLLLIFISSFLFVKSIYGYLTKVTNPQINEFSIQSAGSYIVRHETMNLDGSTYSLYQQTTYNGIPIGSIITPAVLDIPGFNSPQTQTITISSPNTIIVTYQYTRKQYTLTINDSNYVTTSTPSGTYYYGTEIHLVADAMDNNSYPFIKWTDDTYNRDYTFTLTGNTTIGPVYNLPYIVTFEPNNGDSQTTRPVVKTDPIGPLPTVKNDDCVGDQGDYATRQCTYFYSFEGWYKESTFDTEVDENFVPTEDITLYAKWRKVYTAYSGQYNFDGTNYLDTGVKLFDEENINKNFEISFDIVATDSTQLAQATLVNAMLEKSPYPGFVFRFQTDSTKYEFNSPKIANKNNISVSSTSRVVIKRVNDVYFIQINNGNEQRLGTYSGTTFDETTVIGASIDGNGNPWRFFKGTLENISIIVSDAEEYTIRYDANGGTGTMEEQTVRKDIAVTLRENTFVKDGKMFNGWNTQSDGNGTWYDDLEQVTNLTTPGEVVTLYAMWSDGFHYNVRFNANGGTGSMNNQEHIYATSKNLSTNLFTRNGYIFCGWNTSADGSGTFYKDGQSVRNLTDVENDIVDLFAIWEIEEYEYSGNYVFDGTNYIDTGIHLFSEETVDKDFDISFEIVQRISNSNQETIMSAMDERASPWPGIVYRVQSSTQDNICANVSTSIKTDSKFNNSVSKVLLKRRNGILYVSFDDGADQQLLNMTSFTQTFDVPVTFGCSINGSGNPQRYFKGTLKDINVKLYE